MYCTTGLQQTSKKSIFLANSAHVMRRVPRDLGSPEAKRPRRIVTSALERGRCFGCGQRNVLGRVDDRAGDYGRFQCAACMDAWYDEMVDEDQCEEAHDIIGLVTSLVAVGQGARRRGLRIVSDPGGFKFRCLGANVWSSAKVLIHHLEAMLFRQHPEGLEKVRILELGAGCGLPGLALAQMGAIVTLTDVPELCPLLQENVTANFGSDGCVASDAPLPVPPRSKWTMVTEVPEDATQAFSQLCASPCRPSVRLFDGVSLKTSTSCCSRYGAVFHWITSSVLTWGTYQMQWLHSSKQSVP